MSGESITIMSPYDITGASEWDGYVDSRPEAHAYHRLIWCSIISESFEHEAYPLIARRQGKVCGILPLVLVVSKIFGRFLVSMPFVNYGGILADDESASAALLRAAENLRRNTRARSVEMRRQGPQRRGFQGQGRFQLTHKVTMLLDLPRSSEALWASFKDTVRNQTRKALKNDLQAVFGGAELLDKFYDIFCINMRNLGTPVYGKYFFAHILKKLNRETVIIAVRQGDKTMAAGIIYSHGQVMEMPWAASLPEWRKLCPNNLLYWEAMSRAVDEGREIFDFGRSSPGSGPWRFKAQWGAREVPLCWDYLLEPGASPPNLTTGGRLYSLGSRVWKKLPLALTRIMGPGIVRGIP